MRKADRDRQKQEAKRERQRVEAAARKAKALGINTKGLKTYVLQLNCGCCDREVWFRSEETLKSQFTAVGLTVSATIHDDLGQAVERVDTFYGYRREKEARRGLDYLVRRLAQN